MPRFFNRIRKQLAKDNKFFQYSRYAVGEILLVVIGILIALQVNAWDQELNDEVKIRSILSEIMDELISDIDKTTVIMNYFSLRDSTIFLVLNGRVTLEDYQKNEIPFLNSIVNYYNRVNLTENSYTILKQNLEIVPDEYNEVIKNLNSLYSIDKKWVDQYDEEMGKFLIQIQEYYRKNYSWFSGSTSSDRNNRIEYMLNNFRYRNDVKEYYTIGVGNQLRFSLNYRRKAIKCYNEIAMLLNKPKFDQTVLFNPEDSKKFIGDWEVVGEPEIIVTFFKDDKRLYFKDNINQGSSEIFWLPPYKILSDNLLYGSLIKDGDDYLLRFNTFDLKKVDK